MEFLEMARKRYSVRRFDTVKKIEEEKINRILEAAQLAPSAHNFQSERILVLESEETLLKLRDCTPCHYYAPLAFVISYDRNVCWKREADGASSGQIDASIAAVHMMYEAFEQGIGCTWVMGFHEQVLKTTYNMPEALEPVAILVCGYPSSDVRPSSRHAKRESLDVLVKYNSYEEERAGGEELNE